MPPPPTGGDQIDLPPPPPPPAPESSSQRFIPTPFLTKTYQLVDDSSIDSIISWNDDGTSFVIWNPAEFARDVLPKFFKHNNFSSFVRQLNTYGFRKVMPDRWEFSNDCFRRGDKRLLCDIVRRKMTSGASSSIHTGTAPMEQPSTSNSGEGNVFSSNSTPSSAAPTASLFLDQSKCNNNSGSNNNYNGCNRSSVGGGDSRSHLMDENDRLKKENTQLCKELSQMKSMCTNIYSMMSNYNPGSGPVPGLGQGRNPLAMLGAVGCGSSNSSQAESMMNPVDLMSGRRLLAAVVETQAAQAAENEEDISLHTKLFGFQLGSKRARGESSSGSGEPMEQDDLLQLQQPGSSFSR